MSTKICLDCMYYIKTKMAGEEQSKAVASVLQTTKVAEDIISGAILVNGLDCSLDDVKNVITSSANIPSCQEYAKKIGCENICKLCRFSTTYSQYNIELEEQLLHLCIQDQAQFRELIDFLSMDMPENIPLEQHIETLSDKLFHAEFLLSCQNTKDILLAQLYRITFLCLLKMPNNVTNILEYLQRAIDEQFACLNCDPIMKKKYRGEIERIASLKIKNNKTDIIKLAKSLLLSEPKQQKATGAEETTTSIIQNKATDMIEDVDFISWSYDEKQNMELSTDSLQEEQHTEQVDIIENNTETSTTEISQEVTKETECETLIAATEMCDVMEEPEISKKNEVSDVCISGHLNQNGFLYNHIVMPKNANYIYVASPKEELMLKYAIMLDFDVAVEPATWKENGKQGLLLYFFKDSYFYFLPFEHMKKTSFCALKGLFMETYHTVYTMISIPLFYRLFTLELEEINVLSLYDLYAVVNGTPCEEPYNIIRMVATEFEKDPETYLPYTMPFYKSIAKKYLHRCDKTHKKEVAQRSYQNHTISMSYSLKKLCNLQQTYLSFANGNCSYSYNDIKEFTSPGERLHISYKNPIDNTSRYSNAFRQVLQKLYTCKVYKNCRYYILDIKDDYMEIYVSNESKETFLSILHHLLIKSGQRYISDIPHVEIVF